jgi:hypothetical protein
MLGTSLGTSPGTSPGGGTLTINLHDDAFDRGRGDVREAAHRLRTARDKADGAIDKPITSFSIADDGVLTFAAGDAHIRATPDPDYESWHVTGPGPRKQMVVCLPAGELAIWD